VTTDSDNIWDFILRGLSLCPVLIQKSITRGLAPTVQQNVDSLQAK
jgi:hypothetical protein